MDINDAQLESAFSVVIDELKEQNLPGFMKKRWARALQKAKERLTEHPFFAWQPAALLLFPCGRKRKVKSDAAFTRQTNRRAAALINPGCVKRFSRAFRAGIALRFCF